MSKIIDLSRLISEKKIYKKTTHCGGLGLHNIAAKATANLTVSFIQFAVSSKY